jgi:hypothetical protein
MAILTLIRLQKVKIVALDLCFNPLSEKLFFAVCFGGYSRLGLDCFATKVRSPEMNNLKEKPSFSDHTLTEIHPTHLPE